MDRTSELALMDEIADLLARGTTAMAPDVGRVGAADLVGPERTSAEQRLFTDRPLVVAPAAAIPRPGDFVADEIVGIPLLVVRGDDGVARVLLNACRHRGNLVCQEPSGNRRVFSCEYHAWTYDRQGRCRSVVDRVGFAGLGEADTSLVAFPAEERHGLIWTRLAAGADLDVAAWLGPDLDAELAGYAPTRATSTPVRRRRSPSTGSSGSTPSRSCSTWRSCTVRRSARRSSPTCPPTAATRCTSG
ncbi:aromatic ring-hydroxylating dioxygenase subunit alpha [Pseudonocardia benzenivorans]